MKDSNNVKSHLLRVCGIAIQHCGLKEHSEHESFPPNYAVAAACYQHSFSEHGINHIRPGLSRILLFSNFYEHFGLNTLYQDEYDTDVRLEFEESETYQHFLEFYEDVLPEFEKCGHITQFKVCNNEESHLRGNVYVEYESKRQAMKAFCTFQGRFYGGKQLAVEFTDLPSWKDAVCGLFHRQKCPKGRNCNFLHVFRDPYYATRYKNRYRNLSLRRSFSKSPSPTRKRYSRENWKWSDESDTEDVHVKHQRRSKSRDRNGRQGRKKYSRRRSNSPNEDVKYKDCKKKRKERSRSISPRHDRKHKKEDKNERRNYDCYSNGAENSINSDKKDMFISNGDKRKRRKKVIESCNSRENKHVISKSDTS